MLALLLLLAVPPAHAADIDLAGATIVVREDASDTEVFAARELSRYFRLLSGKESPVAPRADQGPTVVVGVRPDDLPADAGDQTYLLEVGSASPPWVVVGGKTPIAVQYAAYSLLEKLGVGFYLGGDALPERRGRLPIPADLSEVRAPVFAIRGSLPWYNFLNSPTTWDLEDYQYFFDQMAKMKDNFVGFHSYDHEPFCAYPWEGEWRMGQPAATSMTYGWGAIGHLKTDQFGFGTGRYFPYDVFGSRSVALAKEPAKPSAEGALFPHRTLQDDTIIRAQCVLAQGLQYAKLRGVKTCLGFELVGDPTDPKQRRQEEARIRHMLATYPMLDYVWFWQSEGLGGGSNPNAADTPLDLIVQRLRPHFEYLGNENRIAEAVRVAAWVEFAHGVVKRLRPDLKVIVSGWGGDAWMRFSDFYVGLDEVLPKDIIFSALDNIDPTAQDHVSEAYGKLSAEREKWPIPWFESDGGGTRRDQWGPQCNVKPFTALVRDAQKRGCQGLLGIHWEVRGVEEVAAYCAQFAWDPSLTYEQFYETFARKCYGGKHGSEMAQIHMRLEALGPRWTGGPGQVECGGFQWFSDDRRPKPENMEALREIAGRLDEIESDNHTYTAWERLNYLKATADFLLSFDEAALALAPDGPVEKLLQQAEAAKTAGNAAEAARLAEQAITGMREAPLGAAMEAYHRRLTTQGDFGNLATIDVKAYAAFLRLWERAEAALGRDEPLPDARPPTRWLTVKTPPTAVPQGVALPVYVVAPGSRPDEEHLLAYWRPGGPRQYRRLTHIGGNLFLATIPGGQVGPRGVEFQVAGYLRAPFPGELGMPLDFWPHHPGGSFHVSALPHSGPAVYGPFLHRTMSLAPWVPSEGSPAFLRSTCLSATEYDPCRVEARIQGKVALGTSTYHLGVFPLVPELLSQPTLTSTLRATDASGHVGTGPVVTFSSLASPAAPASVKAELAGPYLVRVTWEPVPGAATYEVLRSEEVDLVPSPDLVLAEWPWTVYDDVRVRAGTAYQWAVIAVGDARQRSKVARTQRLLIPEQPPAKAPAGLAATPGLGRVTLTWQPTGERVAGYAVFVRPEAAGDWQRVNGIWPVKGTTYVVGGLTDTNPRLFAVRSVDRGGREGETTEAVRAAALPVPREPVFATSFTGTKADTGQEGKLGGKATIHDGVLDTRDGGWLAYPGEELLQAGGPLSVEFRINVERVEGIPVMLSFGHFDGPGYWLQLIGGGIRWYLPHMRILDAGALPTGSWRHLAATYDGQVSRLYVDGKEVGTKDIGPIDLAPWGGELRIGQYSDLEAQFQTRAQFDDVRIYQRALSAEEVRAAPNR